MCIRDSDYWRWKPIPVLPVEGPSGGKRDMGPQSDWSDDWNTISLSIQCLDTFLALAQNIFCHIWKLSLRFSSDKKWRFFHIEAYFKLSFKWVIISFNYLSISQVILICLESSVVQNKNVNFHPSEVWGKGWGWGRASYLAIYQHKGGISNMWKIIQWD